MSYAGQGLYHDGTTDFLQYESGEDRGNGLDGTARVRLRVPAGTLAAAAVTYTDAEERHFPLDRMAEAPGRELWEGSFPFRSAEHVRYRFKVVVPAGESGGRWFPEWFRGPLEAPRAGGRVLWLTQGGVTPYAPTGEDDFAFGPEAPPEWVGESVFYQIFPDRFADGDPGNNPRDGEFQVGSHPAVARRWGELPQRSQGGREFYGGDLQGVLQRLDYLQDLGITGIYLNPIFEAPSSHKYDTQDYRRVDPHLGGDAAFRALAAAMHERGMRLVLDGVFNHVGATHPWMNKAGLSAEPGAYQGGPTRDHFTFESDDPESYIGWLGVKSLPKLDFANADVREKVYTGHDSAVRYWLRPTGRADDAADGWRLDVVHMMGEGGTNRGNLEVLRGLRSAMKQERPDSYLFGEHFYEATAWLRGDVEDGAMNYHAFTWPTWAFLAGTDHRGEPAALDAAEYDEALRRGRAKVPYRNHVALFNQLDSHDTPRLLSLLPDRRLARLAVVLLFTAVGVPCVYYGDEVGLEGGQDPDCRRTMPWEEDSWDAGLRGLYRWLIQLRRSSPALQRGGWGTVHASGDCIAYLRRLGRERVLAVVNRGASASLRLPLAGEWQDLEAGMPHAAGPDGLVLDVAECSYRLLRRELAPSEAWL
ncbi:MAG TPA: maltodextrin glucosidase [Deinococcales bacterium]|nr:maltodextrin glucosidase [Deinococcales bacterium]